MCTLLFNAHFLFALDKTNKLIFLVCLRAISIFLNENGGPRVLESWTWNMGYRRTRYSHSKICERICTPKLIPHHIFKPCTHIDMSTFKYVRKTIQPSQFGPPQPMPIPFYPCVYFLRCRDIPQHFAVVLSWRCHCGARLWHHQQGGNQDDARCIDSTNLNVYMTWIIFVEFVSLIYLQESLRQAKWWVKQVKQECDPGVVIALVGNKLDLAESHRDVPTEVSCWCSCCRCFFGCVWAWEN